MQAVVYYTIVSLSPFVTNTETSDACLIYCVVFDFSSHLETFPLQPFEKYGSNWVETSADADSHRINRNFILKKSASRNWLHVFIQPKIRRKIFGHSNALVKSGFANCPRWLAYVELSFWLSRRNYRKIRLIWGSKTTASLCFKV